MTTTLNASYEGSPLTVSQGGTGVASTTAFGLLAGGTTSTSAIQNAGTGAAGQIYLSGGAASLGTYNNNVTSTCFQYISQLTASSSASLEFTGLSSKYYAYKIILNAIVPASSAQLYVTFSNASGYFTANYSYAFIGHNEANTAVNAANSSAAQIQLTSNALPTTANRANSWEITLYNPSASNNYNGLTFMGRYFSTNFTFISGEGSQASVSALTKIKFAMSTGSISTGNATLFGVLA